MPVVLLCHCDGTNGSTTFTDVSPSAHTLTATSTTVSTSSPKFGTGSADFTASGATSIDTGNATDFNFGNGQFTVEAWAWFNPTGGVQAVLSQFGGSSNLGWFFGLNSGQLAFFYSTTGTDNPSVSASYSPALGTWIHLASDRDAANVLRVYANGAVIASATVSATFFASTQTCIIGNDHNINRAFPGRLDEVRITKGLARYAGAFTPPTAPFSDTSALATQVTAEHWLTTNPDAQVTQVAVEHWMSVASTFSVPLTPAMMLSASRAGIGSVVMFEDNTTRTVMIADVGAVQRIATVVPTPPGAGDAVRCIIMA